MKTHAAVVPKSGGDFQAQGIIVTSLIVRAAVTRMTRDGVPGGHPQRDAWLSERGTSANADGSPLALSAVGDSRKGIT